MTNQEEDASKPAEPFQVWMRQLMSELCICADASLRKASDYHFHIA